MTPADAAPIVTDAVVIGAGPVGLFQVFQLGLHEVHAEVIDALPHLGGQCLELYPDKPIYDIPGVPVCSGRELVAQLERQMAPMKPGLHLGRTVTRVGLRVDGRYEVETSTGQRFEARSVVIAAGVGAFEPKRVKLDGLEAYEPAQWHHHGPAPQALRGSRVIVLGGEEAAVDTALALTDASDDAPASVTLVHRREVLKAAPEALAELSARIAAGRLRFIVGQPTGHEGTAGRLQALHITRPDAVTTPEPVDHVLVRLGISPRLGAVADWGLAMERKQLVVDTERYETSVPGIHAVGDINTYPGKRKLILCGFHEATMAAFAIAARLFPERPQHLQYTTTSTRLHRLLGVGG
jgi:thioredoxin reductase (NADPH)